ncbi:ARM repeat-containing protein [Coprinopsis marcescibilis]|uniref:ARM repeat-containing protein n=1 Tax=Coprinopsis marcescibilis TaxID=230819 RepID=A0A5C3LGE4_COPMA|nr:ARM repeat-containing protein [Coprinopsis marcescibilis]
MDLQTLTNLFTTTYNPDPNIRKAAELEIRKIGNEEGVITALLQIVSNTGVEQATRQACAVWLKNRVYKVYSVEVDKRPEAPFIVETDRDALRINILHLLASAQTRAITTQLGTILKTIIAHDFPEKWPGFIDQVKQLLESSNIGEVHAGCIAALEAVKAFKFRQKNDILPKIVEAIFPTLVNIATQMVQQPPTEAQEIPTMLHLILKTYKSSITVNLSQHQQDAGSLVPWGQLLFTVVNLQLPENIVPKDEEERERSAWWKAKKWAYAILGRLFHRFGNPSQLPSALQKEYGAFSQHFVTMFAPEILNIYLKQVQLYVSGQVWLSKKCQYHIFTFFNACIKPKSTWAQLKPHFETLVSTFVFNQLTFNEARKELWETDPVDYVRVSVDEYESYATPVSSATTFLLALATNRTKITFMPILGFINNILRSNAAAPQRFGALNMAAALSPHLMSHPQVKHEMETFILSFVSPALEAPEPYLRAIALEIIGTVVKHGIQFSTPEILDKHFRAVAKLLDDPEFPVKVQAALALTEMVMVYDEVRAALAPEVGKVIQDLLKMSDDTDLNILNNSMEVMVNQYHNELLPVAAQLTAHLCESYMRCVRDVAQQDVDVNPNNLEFEDVVDVNDDKTFAAMGVAKTISTVVDSIDSSNEILAQVQEIIIPILVFTLENKIIDLFDNVYELIDSLTFHLKIISPNMWRLYELTYSLFKSDAVDFLEEMLPSLDNFVSYGTDVIKNNEEYKRMAVDIYTSAIAGEHLGENDRVNGCKLAESVLLNLRGSVDGYLEIIIKTAFSLLDKTETAGLRLANLEVLINAVLYNPSAALHLMGAANARIFFDRWFAEINAETRLPRVHDKKLSILTLAALLELPEASIPEALRAGWPGIVAGALRLFKDLPKAIERRKALEAEFQEESDDEESYGERLLNLNDEEGDVWDDESAYLEMLANEGARLREKQNRPVDGALDEEDSDDEEEEIEEELGYISPIDSVDPYITFKRALTALQLQNPSVYQASTTSLDIDQQTLLMEVMRLAENNAAVATAA